MEEKYGLPGDLQKIVVTCHIMRVNFFYIHNMPFTKLTSRTIPPLNKTLNSSFLQVSEANKTLSLSPFSLYSHSLACLLTTNIQPISKLHNTLPMIQLGSKVQCRTTRLSSQLCLQHTLYPSTPINTNIHLRSC